VTQNSKAVTEFKVKVQKLNGSVATDYMEYKGNPEGSYHLVLNEGAYRLTISGPAIQTASQDVVVGSTRIQTDFNL
jgi:hypothetical protein